MEDFNLGQRNDLPKPNNDERRWFVEKMNVAVFCLTAVLDRLVEQGKESNMDNISVIQETIDFLSVVRQGPLCDDIRENSKN